MAQTINYRGTSALTILGIVFVILKLTDKIDWSWWWVLSPFWIPILFFVIIASFFVWIYKKYS